jgi:hypothetical protein
MPQTPRSSCIPKEPLLKLGEGTAPVLDYSLPQKSEFSVYGRMRVAIPPDWFRKSTTQVPPRNWWIRAKDVSEQALVTEIAAILDGRLSTTGLVLNARKLRRGVPRADGVPPAPKIAPAVAAGAKALQPVSREESATAIASAVKQGLMPVAVDTFGGRPDIVLVPQPPKPSPGIYVIEEYGVASYLGDYGAGKTVSTFSLLPGETTTIAVSTYRERAETSTRSESILDSFSQDSADEFESTLHTESGQSSEETEGLDTTSHYDIGLKIDLFGLANIGGETDTERGNSESSTRESYASMTSDAMAKHVTSSSSAREIEVNTSSTNTTTTRNERSITRQLTNINRSRVLNFALRQLQQEYLTVTYLKNVRVMYTNGYPESIQIVQIPQVPAMLRTVLAAEHVEAALARILEGYCAVPNYLGERLPFLERVTEKVGDCPFPTPERTLTYYRKRRGLADRHDGISVPGVILKVDQHILRTESLIADAILGQGEALDCYNMELQAAAVDRANLANDVTRTGIDIVGSFPAPEDRARAYVSVLRECECKDSEADGNGAGEEESP